MATSAFEVFPHITRELKSLPGWQGIDHGAVEAALDGYSLEAEEETLAEFLEFAMEPESQTGCSMLDYLEENEVPLARQNKLRCFFQQHTKSV